MLVLHRFRVPDEDVEQFRVELREALAALASRPGLLSTSAGRNVDDPELWVLETRWSGPGDYRRALSAHDVRTRAWGLLARALDEPSAYELVVEGEPLNEARPRGA